MKVVNIRIENILGVKHLEFAPGAITTVTGRNGIGKTSVLEAIKALIGGGHDANLIRKGADHGEVVLLLDDGTEITKSISESGSNLKAKKNGEFNIGKPQTYLNKLTDALAFNPVAFLTAPPEKRAEWLLEAMPIEVSRTELEAAGLAFHPGVNAIDLVNGVIKDIYDDRTGVNRSAADKRATARQLNDAVLNAPAIRPDYKEKQIDLRQAEQIFRDFEKQAHDNTHELIRKEENAANKQIEVIRREAEEKVSNIQEDLRLTLSGLAEEERSLIAELTEKRTKDTSALAAEIAQMEEQARQFDQAENTRKHVQRSIGEAEDLELESKALTERIDLLKNFKQEILAKLPIPELAIDEGQITYRGIAFERLNTASKIDLALQVALLRAGELKLICVDGMECLDDETFAAFEEAAAGLDAQFIVARVSEEEQLTVMSN